MINWKSYWAGHEGPYHRTPTEKHFEDIAAEVLFHFGDGGKSLLDFGCGAALVLPLLAKKYEKVIGADFSPAMIKKAQINCKDAGLTNIKLIEADDKNIWQLLDGPVDNILVSGVVQYMKYDQVYTFIKSARDKLSDNGTLLLFDCIDPRLSFLLWTGVFNPNKVLHVHEICVNLLKLCIRKFLKLLIDHKEPVTIIGNSHHPVRIKLFAETCGYKVKIVSSLYHEYRYHAILKKA